MHATLTARQARILGFIRDHTRTVGYPPTVREIGAHAGLTATSSVHRQLEVLVAKGYLRREGGRSRAVVVIDHTDGAAA
jgi:repressor LexA